jgi:hypothetical protein
MRTSSRLGVALLALATVTCQSVPLLAPPGSSLTLIANPDFIASHGGISRIIAIVTEATGAPVADGTQVMFFTDLGRIDERGLTNDGVAQVNLISDSRSGVATVTAISGGGQIPTASPSPTVGSPAVALKSAAAANSDTVEVTIGNARIVAVHLRAEPGRIGTSRSTVVIATVFDTDGNPIPNVPVYFRVAGQTPGTSQTEFFDNSGPVFTDNNGEADTVLRTRRDVPGSVQVVAEAPGPAGMVASETLTIPVF